MLIAWIFTQARKAKESGKEGDLYTCGWYLDKRSTIQAMYNGERIFIKKFHTRIQVSISLIILLSNYRLKNEQWVTS